MFIRAIFQTSLSSVDFSRNLISRFRRRQVDVKRKKKKESRAYARRIKEKRITKVRYECEKQVFNLRRQAIIRRRCRERAKRCGIWCGKYIPPVGRRFPLISFPCSNMHFDYYACHTLYTLSSHFSRC